MTGNIISEVDAVTYVTLSKAEKHVQYVELSGVTECRRITLHTRWRKNRGRYNRVKLYLYSIPLVLKKRSRSPACARTTRHAPV
jgi:hypothetical protein